MVTLGKGGLAPHTKAHPKAHKESMREKVFELNDRFMMCLV